MEKSNSGRMFDSREGVGGGQLRAGLGTSGRESCTPIFNFHLIRWRTFFRIISAPNDYFVG
jgi:hypothetical protein